MKSPSSLLVVFLCFFGASADSSGDASLDSARLALAFQRYEETEKILRTFLLRNPDNIDALYLLVAGQQTRLLDYEAYLVWGDAFLAQADSVLRVLERLRPRQRGADSIRCLFYIGSVHGGKSVVHAKCDRWIPAISDGLTSTGLLRQVRKLDPQFHEARLGTGVFKYYLGNDLRWLPGLGNRAEEGLEDILAATRANFPYNLAAKDLLCWILMGRGEYGRADSIALGALESVPDHSLFLRIRAHANHKMQRWKLARNFSQRLIVNAAIRTPVNWSDLLVGYRILCEFYEYHNKSGEIRELSREYGKHTVPPEFFRVAHIRDHHRRISELGAKYER